MIEETGDLEKKYYMIFFMIFQKWHCQACRSNTRLIRIIIEEDLELEWNIFYCRDDKSTKGLDNKWSPLRYSPFPMHGARDITISAPVESLTSNVPASNQPEQTPAWLVHYTGDKLQFCEKWHYMTLWVKEYVVSWYKYLRLKFYQIPYPGQEL